MKTTFSCIAQDCENDCFKSKDDVVFNNRFFVWHVTEMINKGERLPNSSGVTLFLEQLLSGNCLFESNVSQYCAKLLLGLKS